MKKPEKTTWYLSRDSNRSDPRLYRKRRLAGRLVDMSDREEMIVVDALNRFEARKRAAGSTKTSGTRAKELCADRDDILRENENLRAFLLRINALARYFNWRDDGKEPGVVLLPSPE